MNICIVCGARPNFIKVAPVIRAIKSAKAQGRNVDYALVYSGAADDPTLEGTLFDDLQIQKPDMFLGVTCSNLNELTGQVMAEFERYLQQRPADVVVVVADLSKVYMVGNVLIDNLRFDRNRLVRPACMDALGLDDKGYLVFTLNRKVLIEDKDNLQQMIAAIGRNAHGMKVIAPLRGLAKAVVEECQKALGSEVLTLVEPLPYLQFGYLTAHAAGVITDSGNVAEEATFNQVPCITLNSYTEHEETVKVGTSVLVGEDADKLGEQLGKLVTGQWKHAGLPDRWDGRSAERIVQILLEQR